MKVMKFIDKLSYQYDIDIVDNVRRVNIQLQKR